jgi:hypothetical protein
MLTFSFDVTAALLMTMLYDPSRFWWAGRSVTAIVFLAYVLYVVDEIRAGTMKERIESVAGLLVIGLPSLRYTLNGRFSLHEDEETKKDGDTTAE